MKKIILFLALLAVSLPVGGAIISFVAPWEYDVSASTFMDWHRHIDAYMGRRGVFIGPPSLLILLVQIIIFWRDREKLKASLVLFTFIMNIVGMVIAIVGNVPINQQLQSLDPGSIPADWEQIRDQWLGFHFWRNITALIGFTSFAMIFFVESDKK